MTLHASVPHRLGTCTLVGAGPGDPDLLTLKAVKAIASASVIFIDDLVNEAVLAHASAAARVVYVGKRGGCKSTPQAFIQKLMLQAVAEGHCVVRLKGGDPFIFGRGGEEVQYLREHGIEASVVNGITSGLAGLSSLNAPVTHRDHAHGVLFITGHQKPGDGLNDWPTIARTATTCKLTLVIYMGISGANPIEKGLRSALPCDTPVAVIENASLPTQRHVLCTLGSLTQTIALNRLASPSIIVVGDVVKVSHLWADQTKTNLRRCA
jgi:uroporphyrin-III C-methyltransferase